MDNEMFDKSKNTCDTKTKDPNSLEIEADKILT